MYHSVIIDGKNTYSDWHLVPDSRPVISMPTLKKDSLIEIPGVSGSVDLMSFLIPYPVYANRTGQLKFHVLNDKEPWEQIHHKIANHLHKRNVILKLEDDPDYFYKGFVTLNEWVSNNNGTWSDVVLDYDLDPYKISVDEYSNSFSVSNSTETVSISPSDIGSMPVCPRIVVSEIGNSGITLTASNPEANIVDLVKNISSNGTYVYYDIVLTNLSGNNSSILNFTGTGSVAIIFDKGYL